MIGGGFDWAIKHVEIVDLENSTKVCQPLPDFPTGADGSAGFLHNGHPMICGGLNHPSPNRIDPQGCWMLSKDIKWEQSTQMLVDHHFPAVVSTSDSTFVFGGANNFSLDGSTVIEVLHHNSSDWSYYEPVLPVETWQHCAVMINSTTVMLLGGMESHTDTVSSTYLHTFGTDEWTKGPSMIKARAGHSCGNIEDFGQSYIVVVGGNSNVNMKTTEILDIDTMVWKSRPDLPNNHNQWHGAMISFNNSLILFGGFFNDMTTLYQLSSINGTWMEMEQKLTNEAPNGLFAFLIPDEYTTCH
jgi:hypothetical protein